MCTENAAGDAGTCTYNSSGCVPHSQHVPCGGAHRQLDQVAVPKLMMQTLLCTSDFSTG